MVKTYSIRQILQIDWYGKATKDEIEMDPIVRIAG
jgi:hypothetical protein